MTLKKQFVSGFVFTAITKYSNLAIQLLIIAVLARLLTPTDFGLVAVVTVFLVFFNLMADMGIGPAIIQNPDLNKSDLNGIFSFTVLFGLVLGGIFFLCAPIFANFYTQKELLPLFRIMSLNIFFVSINIVPNSLLLKNRSFKFIMARQLSIQAVSGFLAIIMAICGAGVYALIANYVTSSILIFIVNFVKFPHQLTFFSIKSMRKIAIFSIYQLSFNFINYFSRNLDKLLIGKYLSMSSLGFYEKSYQLMMLPVSNLTHVMTPVIQPVFLQIQNDKDKIFSVYMKIVRVLSLVGFPLSVFLYFSAKEMIVIVFGNQWLEAIPIFEILAWSVGIQIVLSSTGSIFQVTNKPNLLFWSGLLSAIFMVGAICFGVFILKSMKGVAYGLLIAFVINFFQSFYMLINIVLHQSFLDFLKILLIPLITSIVIFIGLGILIKIPIENIYFSLIAKGLISCTLFTLVFLFSDKNRQIIKSWLKNYTKKNFLI